MDPSDNEISSGMARCQRCSTNQRNRKIYSSLFHATHNFEAGHRSASKVSGVDCMVTGAASKNCFIFILDRQSDK